MIAVIIAAFGFVELVGVYRLATTRRLSIVLIASAAYVVIAAAFVFFVNSASPERVAWLYLQVAIFDGFSQISGQLVGRHRLAPSISPNKTVEGSVGGIVLTVATGLFLHRWIGVGVVQAIGASVFTSVVALAGDLLAARYKRLHGAKDFSNLIPEHGGMLDRFNGFLAAGAAWAGVLTAILLAMLGAMWRVGSVLGSLRADIEALTHRIDLLQANQTDHDRWHRDRLLNHKDIK